ncbi:MAG: hypothetical protein RIB93_19135 [Coleofasciculus sp. D1-CHI-01]|uniref:hypothetical protein n=1 Tax=Coleofasciculus sp. D1-CHI-01 TaxID=3068482 RepID=UPI003301D651
MRAGFVQQLSVTCQRLVPKPAPTDCVDEGAIARLGKGGFCSTVNGYMPKVYPSRPPLRVMWMRARSHSWGRAGFVQQLAVICQRFIPKPAPTGYVDEGAIAWLGEGGFCTTVSGYMSKVSPSRPPLQVVWMRARSQDDLPLDRYARFNALLKFRIKSVYLMGNKQKLSQKCI